MSELTYATVLSSDDGEGVRIITLNRPESLNAMNRTLIEDVKRAFDDADADKGARVIVFTGAGRALLRRRRQARARPPRKRGRCPRPRRGDPGRDARHPASSTPRPRGGHPPSTAERQPSF